DQVRRERVVGLEVDLVAERGLIVALRIWTGVVDGGASGGGIAVCSTDVDGIAEVGVKAELRDVFADGIKLCELLPLASDAVAHEVVPFLVMTVLDGGARVEILVGLFGGGGDSEEVVCVGNPGCGDGVTDGKAQRRVGCDVV